ncbi:MAG: hypothetical protein V4717_13820 [Bacteroidota bacterium]
MRKILFFAVLGIILSQSSFAKIWRVNNKAGITANFTTLQAAHDSAASGDTIHLEGSPFTYGGLTCSKKVTIIGAGYYLNENPNTQAVKQFSQVAAMTLNHGSAGTSIMGLDFKGAGLNIYAGDITVIRNKFSYNGANEDDYAGIITIYYMNNNGAIGASNINISQNYGVAISNTYPSTGLLITNNYITYGTAYSFGQTNLGLNVNSIALVQNNVFNYGNITAYNSSFTNNIMLGGTFNGTGNLTANNIGNANQFGSLNGNKANIDMATVFIGTGEGISSDGRWKLKAGSPGIASGYGSTAGNPVDIGMYGGTSKYVPSGMPPIPAVYFFENQPIGSNTDPIDVQIKVKSN